MKNYFILLSLLPVAFINAQTGINTQNPKSTLHVSVGRNAITNTIIDNTKHYGLIPPTVTRKELTENTAIYDDNQRGAIIFVNNVDEGDQLGSRYYVNSVGYYFFDGYSWRKLSNNIYENNGTFADNRDAYISTGKYLNFSGPGRVGIGEIDERAKLNVDGNIMFAGDSDYGVGKVFNDLLGEKYGLTQTGYWDADSDIRSPGTRIYTSGRTSIRGNITFGKYTSPTAFTEFARFAHQSGFFGINTTNASVNLAASEALDVNGNVRVRTLPKNGTLAVVNTGPTGAYSAVKSAFNAVRTVVADANGVLGYVDGLPSAAPDVAVSSSAEKTISRVYSVPNSVANSSNFDLKQFVKSNNLESLPKLDDIEMNITGVDVNSYNTNINNTSSSSKLVTIHSSSNDKKVNSAKINNSLRAQNQLSVSEGINWGNNSNVMETANMHVKGDDNIDRWYELVWWCLEVDGAKKIFLTMKRKA